MGITSHLDPYFSIGLGAQAVNPLEMARAYATFANGGRRIDGSVFGDEPRAITTIDGVVGEKVKRLYDNAPEQRQELTPVQDELLTQLLEGVVTDGTGTAAALPGYTVAGKTGTTENYGDAWFVGYTPQLVAAVWVGYPDKLRPMLTEFHGGPVAGGTFPALIWKAFMQPALKAIDATPETFPAPPYLSAQPRTVTYRDGRIELSNGQCPDTSTLYYFIGDGPSTVANCKLNEVDVPNVVGLPLTRARGRLQAQPLTAQLIYKPATAGEKVGVVLKQFPRTGTLSSYGKVTLVLAKPLHGVVPRVVGSDVAKAKVVLAERKLQVAVATAKGAPGRVLAQSPAGGVAATPGMTVRLTVGAAG
jgi:membrane peptidoglycan carboxypeptidase